MRGEKCARPIKPLPIFYIFRKKCLNQDFQDYRITRIKKFVSPIDDFMSEALF
jgi:hypothetical protein